jgi:hypothetical protein
MSDEINRCGSCKYFGREKPSEWFDDDGLRECQAVKMRGKVSDYDEDADKTRLHPGVIAVTVDGGSDYFSALRVSEDFGCVMWEAK